MISFVEDEKAIRLAAEDWQRRMTEALKKPGRTRIGIDAVVIDKRIEFIELPHVPRIATMAG